MLTLDDRGHREGLPNYAHIPVLGFTSVDKMVDAFIEVGPRPTATFIAILGRRIERLGKIEVDSHGCEWTNEAEWVKRVRDELHKRALQETNKIASVQMLGLVRSMDSFLS